MNVKLWYSMKYLLLITRYTNNTIQWPYEIQVYLHVIQELREFFSIGGIGCLTLDVASLSVGNRSPGCCRSLPRALQTVREYGYDRRKSRTISSGKSLRTSWSCTVLDHDKNEKVGTHAGKLLLRTIILPIVHF